MGLIADWWRRRRAARTPFARNWFDATVARVPALARLPAGPREQLARLVREFLVDKTFVPIRGVPLDVAERTRIATLACWPALHLGYPALAGFNELVVYADAFRARRRERDAHTGVVHEYDQDLAGEAWLNGPLVVSLADLQEDLDHPEDEQNVVIHEVAHHIDGLDGDVNGRPPLHRGMSAQAWADDFGAAYERLGRQLADGAPPIDPYAAESPAEFFAVSSEYHFLAPQRLRLAYPQVAAHLQRFYGGAAAPS